MVLMSLKNKIIKQAYHFLLFGELTISCTIAVPECSKKFPGTIILDFCFIQLITIIWVFNKTDNRYHMGTSVSEIILYLKVIYKQSNSNWFVRSNAQILFGTIKYIRLRPVMLSGHLRMFELICVIHPLPQLPHHLDAGTERVLRISLDVCRGDLWIV